MSSSTLHRSSAYLFSTAMLLVGLHGPTTAAAGARQLNDYHWQDVGRVVAIGDLHGDYEQYRKVLSDAGLIDARGKWSGDEAHLVQTGDVTDRGPDSIAIIEHLEDLKKQARRKGGRVHTLIGNHEAMNSYGDLRYVHEGEFGHFVGRSSAALRERQWEFTLQRLEQSRPDDFAVLNLEQYRIEWEQNYPLGWVEHRNAWMPQGKYGQWMLENPVAVQINDTIFLHGGISTKYCHLSLEDITRQAHEELRNFDPQNPGMIEDPEGPLWYRGLATEDEEVLRTDLDAILARYEAERIVVGHTPTGGVVWPRFGGRVVANDPGIAAYYGGNDAFFEIRGDEVMAGYGGHRLPLPSEPDARTAYLREVIAISPGNEFLAKRLQGLLAPPPPPEPVEQEVLAVDAEPAGPEALSPDMCR